MDTSNSRQSFFLALAKVLFYLIDARCVICQSPVSSPELCDSCKNFNPYLLNSFENLFSAYIYDEKAKTLMHLIKHKKQYHYLKLLGLLLYSPMMRRFFNNKTHFVLIPVPMSIQRFKERGFNQSEWLARKLAEVFGMKVDVSGLRKVRETPPQSTLSLHDRKINLCDAFEWNPKIAISSSVCLIDDILTTGETIKACQQVLRRAGAREIVAWTLFKVPSRVIESIF